ncbi:MAG: TonB-dependent receptor [Saprospiraceae bacterium]|jgi:hypothetical protein|nr:TonB-dependent receptor [Saprospiraceae bacterium]HQU95710.1 TonB-dependent receptor [Saprospiraceae bacterium]
MQKQILEAEQKALEINLDTGIYGTFAEIGAGQEVARYFFQAGAAAGTIAKTMSAYDKTYSDEIYGVEPSGRYVCESRLYKMLEHEFTLLVDRLGDQRPDTTFFAFADTVSATNYSKTITGDGWLGIRFQKEPHSEPNDLVIHVKMLDKDNRQQQQAVGMLGVNLIYACFFLSDDMDIMLKSLIEGLEGRVMIDMIRLLGPAYKDIDNRSLSFKLVKLGLSDVAMFDSKGINIHPSEFLYRKNVLIVRGSFRPITWASYDIIKSSRIQFSEDEGIAKEDIHVLTEITLDILREKGEASEADFLERATALNHVGLTVCITNCGNQQQLIKYMEDFKVPKIGLSLTAGYMARFIDETIEKFRGGKLLEGLSGMFPGNVRLYVYPSVIPGSKELMDTRGIKIDPDMKYLYEHLLATKQIVDIKHFKQEFLKISARKVLKLIQTNDNRWEKFVPKNLISLIKSKSLFGFKPTQTV